MTLPERYTQVSFIGRGTYGKVYKILDNDFNQIVAMKKYISNREESEGVIESIIRELAILKMANHPNIIQMLWYDRINFDKMVMPYYTMDLYEYKKRKYPADITLITTQLLKAIYYLHSLGIVHRDVKPANILINYENQNIVLIDAGHGRKLDIFNNKGDKTREVCTLWYRSPEILLGAKDYHFPVDMWSVGCIVGELVTERVLFLGSTDVDQLHKIFELLGTPDDTNWSSYHKYKNIFPLNTSKIHNRFNPEHKMTPLICGLLEFNSDKRWSSDKALSYMLQERVEDFREIYFKNMNLYVAPPLYSVFSKQTTITNRHRIILLDWLLEICQEYNVSDTAFVKTVGIIDRYCFVNNVQAEMYQLVGLASLWIAEKIEEIYMTQAEDLVFISKDSYTVEQLTEMEKKILRDIDLDLYFPIPMDYISQYDLSSNKVTNLRFLLVYVSFNLSFTKWSPKEICHACYCYMSKGVKRTNCSNEISEWLSNSVESNLDGYTFIIEYKKIVEADII